MRFRSIILLLLLAAGPAGPAAAGAAQGAAPADLQFDYAEGLYRDGLRKLAVAELGKFLKEHPDDPRASQAHFYLAECHYANQDYKAALPEYEAAAKDSRLVHQPFALYRIGDCRFRLGDLKGSIEPLRQFLGATLAVPDHKRFVVHAKYTLARAFFAERQFADALGLFQQVLVDPSPENAYKSYVLLPIGDCLAALDKSDLALQRYQELEKYLVAVLKTAQGEAKKAHEEILARLRAKMAALLLNGKKYDQALAAFGQLSDQGPLAEEVLYGRAQCLFLLQRYQEALVPALACIGRFPQGRLAPSALFIAGESCYRTGQFAEAEKQFAAFLAADKDASHPARETAAYGRAAAAYRQGKGHAKEAAAAADLFLKEFPKGERLSDVVYFRAEAAFWLGQYAAALESYAKVPAASAYAEEAAHQAAVSLDLLHKDEEAAAAYDAYVARYPKGAHHQRALERSARLWGQLKQYAKAAARYGAFAEAYAKTDPKTAEEFLYRKGACEYEAKQFDAMFQTFSQYFGQYRGGSHQGEVLYFLAWYYSEQKKQDERAASLYEQCAKTPGAYQLRARYLLAHAWHRLGEASLAAKREDEANAFFGKAAECFLDLIRNAPKELAGPAEYRWTADTLLKLGGNAGPAEKGRRNAGAAEAYEALISLSAKPGAPLQERLQEYLKADGDATVIYWLGKLYLELDPPNYDRAAEYFTFFDEKLKDHKYFIWAKFGLAEALKGAKKHDLASAVYLRVESLAPHVLKDPAVRDGLVLLCQLQLGRMFYDDKNYEHARKYLLPVGMTGSGAEAAEALYKAGHASRQLKDMESAIGIWRRLLREYPQSQWAKALLAERSTLGLELAADGKTLEPKNALP